MPKKNLVYVLNPGDMQDVHTFNAKDGAVAQFNKRKGAKLYSFDGKTFKEYLPETGKFYEVDRYWLPNKVIDAARTIYKETIDNG
jgi:hypothetical protein